MKIDGNVMVWIRRERDMPDVRLASRNRGQRGVCLWCHVGAIRSK